MAQAKSDIELEDAFEEAADQDDDEGGEAPQNKPSSLAKRRDIDNLLEERRLRRQLAEYDYDL